MIWESQSARSVQHFFHNASVDFGVSDDAAFANEFLARFKLGFDKDDPACARRKAVLQRGQHQLQGYERAVGREEIGRFGDVFRCKVSDIRPFNDDDARILAQFPRELPVAHVDRIHTRSAVLKQAIGEAAGRGARVDRDHAVDIDLELVESRFELKSASADITRLLADVERDIFRKAKAGFVEDLAVYSEYTSGKDQALRLRTRQARPALDQDVKPFFLWHLTVSRGKDFNRR